MKPEEILIWLNSVIEVPLTKRVADQLLINMRNIPQETDIDEIRKSLLTLKKGKIYVAPGNYPSEEVEEILSELSGMDFEIEDFNGVDQDWSDNIKIGEKTYSCWGSARSGGVCFSLD